LFEEINVGGVKGRQIGLAILEEKIKELFLRFHLRADLVDIQALEVHL
jgi:hypothetical protein